VINKLILKADGNCDRVNAFGIASVLSLDRYQAMKTGVKMMKEAI